MVMFDSRPGAIEDLFVTDVVNSAGAYTVKFNVNGKDAFVTVDDYVPVVKNWDGSYKPVYANSMHEGEIWPCIFEKAWAKLVGTYEAIEGGSNWWTLTHMTNDPTERIMMRGKGYTGSNAKGNALWANLLDWTSKEYLMFTGSDS